MKYEHRCIEVYGSVERTATLLKMGEDGYKLVSVCLADGRAPLFLLFFTKGIDA